MYIQITTRCNMHCAHCGFSCTSKGEDMSIATFKKALTLDPEETVLGGGEPTIHPQFWEMLGLALGYSERVWMATNGKEKNTALALARMTKKEVLNCDLSQDKYHERIDWEVVSAFRTIKAIRDVTHNGEKSPIWIGRAKSLFLKEEARQECFCSDFIIRPNGDLAVCGCEDSPVLGNVNRKSFDINEEVDNRYVDFQWGECWKEQTPKSSLLKG